MAAGFTVVRYGDQTIVNCHTTRFDESAEFDDTGTDFIFHRYVIRVTGYLLGTPNLAGSVRLHPNPTSGSQENAGEHHKLVRHNIQSPRQNFKMWVGVTSMDVEEPQGGVLLFDVNPWPSASSTPPGPTEFANLDVRDGPRCLEFNVRQITGNEIFKVEATFEICITDCEQ